MISSALVLARLTSASPPSQKVWTALARCSLSVNRTSRGTGHDGAGLPHADQLPEGSGQRRGADQPPQLSELSGAAQKFYRFLTTEQRTVSREEFADYLCWAADNLTNLAFSQQVQQVSFDEQRGLFEVVTQRDRFWRATSVGIGKQINLPDCVTAQDDTCFHASEMMLRTPDLAGKRVTVVGGGQSGADLFLNIFRGEWGQPLSLNWVSRRNNYNALDEAAFANEYFTPEYVDSFSTLGEEARRQMLHEQKMTSDGITTESLLAIYRAMYHRFEVLRENPGRT